MKKLIIAALTVIAAVAIAEDQVIPLWAEIDPGIRIASMRLRTETDMESASRSVKQDDGTYSVALIRRMVEIIPLTTTGAEYGDYNFRQQFEELEVTQAELIAAGLACDPQITWLGSWGENKSLVIKRAMVTKVGTLLGCEEPTLSAWVNQVLEAITEE